MSGGQDQRQRNLFAGADALTDNVALMEWFETARRVLHAAALELGITASELDARLRNVNRHAVIGGLTGRARARQVVKPIQHAGEALIVASQYLITGATRFEAVYLPELEAVGHRAGRGGREFSFRPQGGGR